MEFIKQINSFLEISAGNIPPNAFAIYLRLFQINNKCGWKEWFTVSDYWLGMAAGISRRETIVNALNLLRQKNLLEFERGKGKNPSRYKLYPLLNSANTSANTSGIPRHKTKTIDNRQVNNNRAHDAFAEVEDDRLRAALMDFAEMRKSIKKPLTDRAKSLNLKKLYSLSQDVDEQIQIVEQSVMNSWQGFYKFKKEGRDGGLKGNSRTHTKDPRFRSVEECQRAFGCGDEDGETENVPF